MNVYLQKVVVVLQEVEGQLHQVAGVEGAVLLQS